MFERSRNVSVGLKTTAALRDGQEVLVTRLTITQVPSSDQGAAVEIEFTPEEMMGMLSGGIVRKEMQVSGRTL